MAASAPGRADIGGIAQWLSSEIESLGVDVHLNSYVDEQLIAEIAPDEVVLATGTMPRTDGMQLAMPGSSIQGFDKSHVYSSWDLLGFGEITQLRGPAVVFDDTGSFEAISVCDVLLAKGLPVTLVSRPNAIGESLPYPPVTAGAARERLYGGNFDFIGGHYLQQIDDDKVDIGVLFTDRRRSIAAQTVVFVGYNEPNRSLWQSLQGNGPTAHMVGDVRGRNSIMSAIHAGAELGRSI